MSVVYPKERHADNAADSATKKPRQLPAGVLSETWLDIADQKLR
jgi:hypothetical protein